MGKPTFTIEEDGYRREFEFVIEQEAPIKLGDGTFGVVYKVKSNDEELAVKLLYDKSEPSSSESITLTAPQIKSFKTRFKLRANSELLSKLKECQGGYESKIEFVYRLSSTGLNLEQIHYLIDSYDRKRQEDTMVEQYYSYERQSSALIRRKLREMGEADLYTGVIRIIAGTENFRSSDAYLHLKDHFVDNGLSVSDYAIVMPLYKYTLKDLLEDGTGNFVIAKELLTTLQESNKIELKDSQKLETQIFRSSAAAADELAKFVDDIDTTNTIYELRGYDLLRTTSFKHRIATILPYLLDLSQGLRALHLVNQYHYDLKPANIFVKLEGARINSVLGDLGFFMTQDIQQESIMRKSAQELLPLGTRHYRSPEQKDYFDICEVEITSDKELHIRDPKFVDTIIEEDDYVVFSKDAKAVKHFITDKSVAPDLIRITLSPETSQLLHPDKRTQAVFYKQQRMRTDLFGFGAIIFDMLTGGRSPERFYERIRSFDRVDQRIDKIMEQYVQVSSFQVTNPELVHLFSDFRDEENNYAPKEIVELILKCMMYKAENTFYREYSGQNVGIEAEKYVPERTLPMQLVFEKLKQFRTKYEHQDFDNLLIIKRHPGYMGATQSNLLEDRLASLEQTQIEDLPWRLARGVWYLKKLVELTRGSISRASDKYFCQLIPTNIVVKDKELDFIFIAYKTRGMLIQDLQDDLVYAKVDRDISNPFVPNYLSFLRRQIQLRKVGTDSYRYSFTDSTLLESKIEPGDWVVRDRMVFSVVEIDGLILKLSPEPSVVNSDFQANATDDEDEAEQYIFYKNIDPCSYYLQMLGIYIYHLFFSGLHSRSQNRPITRDKPLLVTFAQHASLLTDAQEPVKIRKIDNQSDDLLAQIYRHILWMYLRLVFPFHKKSYYRQRNRDEDRILSVNADVKTLQEMIEKFVQVEATALDELVDGIPKSAIDTKDLRKYENIVDFHKSIKASVDVSTKGKGLVERLASHFSEVRIKRPGPYAKENKVEGRDSGPTEVGKIPVEPNQIPEDTMHPNPEKDGESDLTDKDPDQTSQ